MVVRRGLNIAISFHVNMQDAILLIEDNHDLRVCQRQILEEKGFKVYSVTNGKDALNLIQSGFQPQLIICDLMMPIMNGEEFLKFIKDKDLCPNAKVMIVSGKDTADADFMEDHFFAKPLDWQKFVSTTFQLLSKKMIV